MYIYIYISGNKKCLCLCLKLLLFTTTFSDSSYTYKKNEWAMPGSLLPAEIISLSLLRFKASRTPNTWGEYPLFQSQERDSKHFIDIKPPERYAVLMLHVMLQELLHVAH
jgi:hypothetical protein